MSLMKLIAEYDREQQAYIAELELKKEELQQKVNELTNQLVGYVDTVDRMKLDLILSGALRAPGSPETPLAKAKREGAERDLLRAAIDWYTAVDAKGSDYLVPEEEAHLFATARELARHPIQAQKHQEAPGAENAG